MATQQRRTATPPSIVSSASAATLRSFAQGQVLCREGDPPGPLYVICSGSVRAFRRSLNMPGARQDLATLGPGDVVGELAPMLQQLRSATVQALEPTEVVEVSPVHVQALLRQHKSLLRVLTQALKDRAGLTPNEVESILSREGVRLPIQVSKQPPAKVPGVTLAAPAHDSTLVYPKPLTCPACGTRFTALVVHVQKDQPVARTSDFHQSYRPPFNPYDYEVWVCPNDLYAALPADFGKLSELQRPRVAEVVAGVVADWGGERPDFNVDRTFELRERSLLLAAGLYRMRGASPLRLAAVLHRLAWCARERGDVESELRWLAQALHAYSLAYHQTDMENPKTVLRVLYLCGELNARLGDLKASVRWFSEGLRHPSIKDHPHWERMLREQWFAVRSASDG
jgi:uncharacterized protein (DUF2225 family)